MKRKTAKEILAESFREVAEKKSIDKIKVSDITSNCGYSSATFYRQFKDKYDLIAWDYARDAAAIMDQIGRGDYEWKDSLLDWAKHFLKNKEYLANLLLHTSGHDSFIRYMTEIHFNELSKYIRKSSGTDHLDRKTELHARLYCMGAVCLTGEWILGQFEASPEEIAEVYENSMPEPLRSLQAGE